MLARTIGETAAPGGNVVIPTFAIERAQDLMFHLSKLVYAKAIPPVRVYLDSPMAREVTQAVERHDEFLDEETRALFSSGRNPFRFPGLTIVRTPEESKAINTAEPSCHHGRFWHGHRGAEQAPPGHERRPPRIDHPVRRDQARDTLGRQILEGAPEVRVLGRTLPVRARVTKINGFSAHADRRGLARWLDGFQSPPRRLFVTHGDADVAAHFAERARRERGWTVEVPEYLEIWDLD